MGFRVLHQVYNPQSETSVCREQDVGKHEEEDVEALRNINPTPKEAKNVFKEKSDDALSDSIEEYTLFTATLEWP